MSRSLDLLVVGDTNPDLILRGDVRPRFGQVEQLLDAADLVLGGSAAIVAAGAARLGTRTGLVSRVGRDEFGDTSVSALRERGVDVDGITHDPATPTGLTVILAEPGDRAILTLPGAIPTLRPEHVTDAMLASARHIHVASYFLQPALAAGLPELFERAHRAGCTTSLDTNWDPAGQWSGVREALAFTDIFLPNTAELLAVAGRPTADEDDLVALHEAADDLAALGPLIVVKAGSTGAFGTGNLPGGGSAVRASTPGLALDVVDTVGAGDSFDAGFLAAWLRGLDFEESLRWAAIAGSLSTRAAGGITAQAELSEIVELAQ